MIWIYAKKAAGTGIRLQRKASREILRYAVEKHYGRDIDTLTFSVKEGGKPVFAGDAGGILFNISHAGEWAVCVIGDEEAGIDVEQVKPIRERVCVKYLGGYVTDVTEQVRRWTRRESLGKYTGGGFFADTAGIGHRFTEYELAPGYMLTLCTGEVTEAPAALTVLP